MGDTPMAVLSKKHRNLFDYFRQQFAQVTNPPIHPLREAIVMSLGVELGREESIFEENPTRHQNWSLQSGSVTAQIMR